MKHMRLLLTGILILTSALLTAGGSSETAPAVPDGMVTVGKTMAFSWKLSEPDSVEFTIHAATTGWISIGFNPSSRMRDASYVIGYVKGGEGFIRDDFGTGSTSHTADTGLGGTNDVRLISGKEENGTTTLVFTIPLDSGDRYDTILTRGATVRVLMARGADNADSFTSGHREVGSASFVLQ
jgi:hypothetical protein